MLPTNRTSTHLVQILLLEYLEPLGVSQAEFARHLGVPNQRINELIRGKRRVTPESWIAIQYNFDLWKARESADLTAV